MTKRSAQHGSFTIERTYPQARARVFEAWANPAFKAKWFIGPASWVCEVRELDFRVGGREVLVGAVNGEPAHRFHAVYWDIVPDERIVSTYEMHIGEARISVSLATVELVPAGTGTRLVYTEQAVFLDGYEDRGSRERGTHELLDKLGAALCA
jgi:uncharacterized protein YndB with AHSA1/START domain